MRTKKSINRQQSIHHLMNIIFTPLIVVSFLLSSSEIYAVVPDSGEVVNVNGKGVTLNRKPATISDKLEYNDQLRIEASFNNKNSADLDLKKRNTTFSFRALARGKRDTTYSFPCKMDAPPKAIVQIAWSDGSKGACGEGIKVINPNSDRISNFPNPQPIKIAQAQNLENRLFLNASNDSNLRYYCSSVPDSGKGSGQIAAGLTSIEAACQQSQETCVTKNNGNGCSRATMGQWSINDQKLTVSIMCEQNGQHGLLWSEIISGSDSNVIDSIPKWLNRGRLFDNCFLDVYYPDEIIISPESSQETKVKITGLEGEVKINILSEQVILRSSVYPGGLIAKKGQTAVVDRQGNIRPINEENPGKSLRPFPSIPPIPSTPPSQTRPG
jgi:hypothetical protein